MKAEKGSQVANDIGEGSASFRADRSAVGVDAAGFEARCRHAAPPQWILCRSFEFSCKGREYRTATREFPKKLCPPATRDSSSRSR